MLRRTVCLLCIVLLLLPFLSACRKDDVLPADSHTVPEGYLRLADEGKSPYRVVISAEATEDILKIAQEFVDYFKAVTGATLEIVRDDTEPTECEIVIGKTARSIDETANYAAFGEETLLYRVYNKSLLLTGGSDRATAYAVYGFLEDVLGVRYYSSEYEYVPATATLDIPDNLKLLDEPVFWFRSMNEVGAADEKWMVKMRLNSRESLGSERFRRTPYVGGGHGYADWFVHSIGKLAEMPTPYLNTQPCLTDETTYQTVLKNVRAWLEKYPDADLLSISQNDGGNKDAMCKCENCSAVYRQYGHTQSAKWIWFVSKIANELADEYPDVYFDTLAYNFTLEAPSNLEIPDNVIVRLAPAHACINHDYKTCMETGNTNRPKEISGEFLNAMNAWEAIAPHRFIWDYNALFYNYLAPFCNFDYIRGNLKNYADAGIEGVFMQGNTSGSNGFSELRSYLTAKCLWNPNMSTRDYNALIEEFLNGYYGEGTAEPLGEYIEFINEKVGEKHFTLYAYMVTDWFMPFASTVDENGVRRLDYSDMIDPMNAFFDRAEALVTDETQQLHLRKARTAVKYYEAAALSWIKIQYYDSESGKLVGVDPEKDVIEVDTERLHTINKELYDDIIACGIKELSEGQTIPENPNFDNAPLYWGK